MARCGCSSSACTCVVTGEGLATQSGTGTGAADGLSIQTTRNGPSIRALGVSI